MKHLILQCRKTFCVSSAYLAALRQDLLVMMTRVSMTAIVFVSIASDLAGATKGKLLIWYNDRSPACRRMLSDLNGDDGLRREILARYDIAWQHVEPSAALPIFQVCLGGRCSRSIGYRSKTELASLLGIKRESKQSSDSRGQIADALRRLKSIESTQDGLAKNQRLLKDWANALPTKSWTDSTRRLDGLHKRIADLGKLRGEFASKRNPDRASSSGTWLTVATTAAKLIGFGSAAAAGGWMGVGFAGLGIARWLVRRRRRTRQVAKSKREADESLDDSGVAVTPPGESTDPRLWERPEFTPYESDTFAKAVTWSQEQLARKYPGSVGTMTTLNSLISQYLNARGMSNAENPRKNE